MYVCVFKTNTGVSCLQESGGPIRLDLGISKLKAEIWINLIPKFQDHLDPTSEMDLTWIDNVSAPLLLDIVTQDVHYT